MEQTPLRKAVGQLARAMSTDLPRTDRLLVRKLATQEDDYGLGDQRRIKRLYAEVFLKGRKRA